jgi:hypothetical protein
MDPNGVLRELRKLASDATCQWYVLDQHEAKRLGELYLTLDRWLSKGGALPNSWKPASRQHARPDSTPAA